MGIDHSNPYIHSTTVLCDITLRPSCSATTKYSYMVGLYTGDANTINIYNFRRSARPIYVYGVACTGNETSLLNCTKGEAEVPLFCSEFLDVGVLCSREFNTVHAEVHLHIKGSEPKWSIPKLRMGNCPNSTNIGIAISIMRYF